MKRLVDAELCPSKVAGRATYCPILLVATDAGALARQEWRRLAARIGARSAAMSADLLLTIEVIEEI